MEKKIILDTNFLVAPFQFSFDLFDELERLYPFPEVYTIKDAVQEAKSINQGEYKDIIEQFLDSQDIEILETTGEGTVDDLLVQISDEYIIATNDKELKERIKDRGNPVIIIRGKNHLEVVNRRAQDL